MVREVQHQEGRQPPGDLWGSRGTCSILLINLFFILIFLACFFITYHKDASQVVGVIDPFYGKFDEGLATTIPASTISTTLNIKFKSNRRRSARGFRCQVCHISCFILPPYFVDLKFQFATVRATGTAAPTTAGPTTTSG